jgi:hypothetical protein
MHGATIKKLPSLIPFYRFTATESFAMKEEWLL